MVGYGGKDVKSVKSRFVLPFWYRLTWVVPEIGPLNVCVMTIFINNKSTKFTLRVKKVYL